jgi:hypothetical protein
MAIDLGQPLHRLHCPAGDLSPGCRLIQQGYRPATCFDFSIFHNKEDHQRCQWSRSISILASTWAKFIVLLAIYHRIVDINIKAVGDLSPGCRHQHEGHCSDEWIMRSCMRVSICIPSPFSSASTMYRAMLRFWYPPSCHSQFSKGVEVTNHLDPSTIITHQYGS